MKKILLTFMVFLAGFAGIYAQADFKEIMLEGDEPVSLELAPGVNYYTLTAPQSGTIGFHVGWSGAMIYTTDETGSEDSKVVLPKSNADDGVVYLATVEEGQVYYFCTSLIVDAGSMTVGYSLEENSI